MPPCGSLVSISAGGLHHAMPAGCAEEGLTRLQQSCSTRSKASPCSPVPHPPPTCHLYPQLACQAPCSTWSRFSMHWALCIVSCLRRRREEQNDRSTAAAVGSPRRAALQAKIDVARCGICTLKLVCSQCFCLQLTPRPLLLSRTWSFILCPFLSPVCSRWHICYPDLALDAMASVQVDAVCHKRSTARLGHKFCLNRAKTSMHKVHEGCRAHSAACTQALSCRGIAHAASCPTYD